MAKAAAAADAPPAKLGWGKRLQMYVVIMGSYYGYKYYTAPQGKTANAKAEDVVPPESIADCSEGVIARHFSRVAAGSYLSSLEAGSCNDVQLLLVLHQTSLSADAEFATGPMMSALTARASDGGIAGLRVVALDRPCHGFSPCIEGAEPNDPSGMIARLLAGRRHIKHFAFMSSGRDSARHALATVQRRKMASRMLLVRPQLVSPDHKGLNEKTAAVESARWAVMNGGFDDRKDDKLDPLDVASMPRGCTVTVIYLEGDIEDDALKVALEDADVAVEVRFVDSLEEGVVPAVTDMLASDGAVTEDEV